MKKATREAYGQKISQMGEFNKNIVVLDADLSKSTKSADFQKVYPERFFNLGIAEADMMGTAAGLAACGLIPVASTFAIFAAGRAYEQIRNSIAYPNLNVKIIASHAGITVGEDGGSHQAIEDLSLMRGIPGMVVINPCDAIETEKAVEAAINYNGPVYIRVGRMAVENLHFESMSFEIGKGEMLAEGKDALLIGTGMGVQLALEAREELLKEGIDVSVMNIATIKPLDKKLLEKEISKTNKVITIEEHSVIGGLGSAVAEVISELGEGRLKRIGIQDIFGQSGKPKDLLEVYGLTTENIVQKVKEF